MNHLYYPLRNFVSCLLIFAIGFYPRTANAQQLKISDFALFGGNASCPIGPGQRTPSAPGCGVIIGNGSKILGGSIGSYSFIQGYNNISVAGNINCGGTINFSNYDTVAGKITAANSLSLSGKILQAGTNTLFRSNVDVNGNIQIGSGVVSGKITHPSGSTYSGPIPTGGIVSPLAALPILPVMPPITTFPAVGTTNISSSRTITPGSYGNINLSGGQTLTFSGPGIYVFNSIKNSGLLINNFNFDFTNSAAGTFKIYVYGDVDLNILNENLINGGTASRIFLETHGTGSSCSFGNFAFTITNYFLLGRTSQWFGTVWAPYSGINLGSSTSSSSITGAMWSGTQVNVQCLSLIHI